MSSLATPFPSHDLGVATDAFLGVEASLSGKRWRKRGGDDLLGLALAQRLGLPEVLGRVMAARGVDIDNAERYLTPTLRDHLPDPSGLKDMDKAVSRLAQAIQHGEHVAIFGDYDVDGATSTALLCRFLAALDVPVTTYIPDRRSEGYGPNAPALLGLKAQGISLVVTVDCGTLAYAPLQAAADAGLDVIVIDHHAAEPTLPAAVAVVNPNRLDDESGAGMLCAAGVTFLVLVGLNRALREAGFYADRPAPDLLQWLDLVALGTVCDVVPLTGLNRALVVQGLKIIAQRRNHGLMALADRAGVAERLDAYHLGFILGPRVNAGGRVGRSDLGCRLLFTSDAVEAQRLAEELEGLNDERRLIEAAIQEEAIAQMEAAGVKLAAVILAHSENWHHGVIGIVASRLKDRYNRPACVVAWDGEIGRGSGRSVPGINLGAAIIAARQAGLLLNGGGHAMAAGFTVSRTQFEAFSAFLAARVGGVTEGMDLTPELGIDGALQLGGCTAALCETLSSLGPFGAGNGEPRFVLPLVRVIKADVVGNGHVRCLFAGGTGKERIKAISFRSADTPLGTALLRSGGANLHIAGHLRADSWQGRADVQFMIDDATFVHG